MGAALSWFFPNRSRKHVAEVYIWDKKSNSWGHVAVRADNLYISPWPLEKWLNELNRNKIEGRVKTRLPFSYQDEVENFTGRPCDHVYKIQCDVSKIKEWQMEEEKKGSNFLRHYCYDAAVDALRAGGAPIRDEWTPSTSAGMVGICKKLGGVRSKL